MERVLSYTRGSGNARTDYLYFLFTTSGRITRAKYWLFVFCYMLVYLGVLFGIAVPLFDEIRGGSSMGTALVLLLPIVYLVSLIPYVTVAVRRLHDREKSGAWMILFLVVPYALNTISGDETQTSAAELAIDLVAAALWTWGIVELGFLPGTKGPNEYGADPREKPHVAAEVFD